MIFYFSGHGVVDSSQPQNKMIVGVDGKLVNVVSHVENGNNVPQKIIILDCCATLAKGFSPKLALGPFFFDASSISGDDSTMYACAAKVGESAWVSSTAMTSPLTLNLSDACLNEEEFNEKFKCNFCRVVQDVVGKQGEFLLHGPWFDLFARATQFKSMDFLEKDAISMKRRDPALEIVKKLQNAIE